MHFGNGNQTSARRRGWVALLATLVLVGGVVTATPAGAAGSAVSSLRVATAATERILLGVPARASYGSTITVKLTGLGSSQAALAGRRVVVRHPGGSTEVKLGSTGAATLSVKLGPGWKAGPRMITATFYGKSTASGSAAFTVTASTAVTGSLSKSRQAYLSGSPAALRVSVRAEDGSTPSGQVLIWNNGKIVGRGAANTAGKATIALTNRLGVGAHPLSVRFIPNSSVFGSSTARAGTLTAVQGSTTLTSSKVGTWVAGKTAKVKVRVSAGGAGAPGAVTVSEQGKKLASGPLDSAGRATLTLPATVTGGAHRITLTYPTSAALRGSKNLRDLVWAKTTSTISLRLSATAVTAGSRPHAAISVTGLSGKVSGPVTVSIDGAAVRTVAAGSANIQLPALSAGTHTVSVRYGGNSWLTAASASVTVTAKDQSTGPCPASARVCVDLTNSQAWVQSGGKIVYGKVPITSGRPGYRTSAGTFAVYWKDKDHYSSAFANAPMPNSVFFDGGNAFHEGSLYVPSHGCIHLSWEASEYFFNNLDYGDTVVVFGYAPY